MRGMRVGFFLMGLVLVTLGPKLDAELSGGLESDERKFYVFKTSGSLMDGSIAFLFAQSLLNTNNMTATIPSIYPRVSRHLFLFSR
jgi:hypothetical protein